MKTRQFRNRREGGFIQGTILFALAILGVVIAAFAVSNSGSSANTDSERDRVNAGVIIKMGSDLQDVVTRASSDNFRPTIMALSADTSVRTNDIVTTLNLYDPAFRYGTEPVPPVSALTVATSFDMDQSSATVANGGVAAASLVGATTTAERVVTLRNIREGVCRRINQQLAGTAFDPTEDIPDLATDVGRPEGCFGTAEPYTYFRVVAVDAN